MNLKKLKNSTLSRPLRYVIYGQEGVGKSTLVSGSNGLWIDVEDGAGLLDVSRIPFEDGHASSYAQVIEALEAILTQEHDFKTIVIDTVDRLESLIWKHICDKSGGQHKNIESWGYGRGYSLALAEWRHLAGILDNLRNKRNISIVLIAHSYIRTFRNPEGDDYDRYQLRLHEKAAGFIKEWADVVAFMKFDEGASKLSGESKAKGYNSGRRYAYTRRRAAFDAKSRLPLAEEIEIKGKESWAQMTTETAPKANTTNPF